MESSEGHSYEEFTLRNAGYVAPELQARIRATRLLIAGCGLGSTIAEAAVRVGFEHLTLADGDTVSTNNLNRQSFTAADVGRKKVAALADRLRAVNPAADITEFDGLVGADTAAGLVAGCDLALDTIDFLDMAGITALHDECRRQERPAVSAMSAGWGAVAIYFPVGCPCTFRQLFGLPESGPVDDCSYVEHFAGLVGRLQEVLMPEVVQALQQAFTIMKDGKPCPASQVAPGAAAVASLAVTAAVRVLAGLPVAAAPRMIVADMFSACTTPAVDLSQ
jgi:molybdopterin/thiamine biosynthesis adenylyltransferase